VISSLVSRIDFAEFSCVRFILRGSYVIIFTFTFYSDGR